MPEIFLIASAVGLLFVLNAMRALRGPILLIPAFFASWLTIELAPVLLVIHVLAVAVFIVLGGAAAWPGWMALVMSAGIGLALWSIVREAYRSHDHLDEALTAAIGPDAAHKPVAWREFAFPFKLWSRRIKRVRNVPYAAPGGRRLRLDVWHSRDPGEQRPCLLNVPGGAWMSLVTNKNHQGKPLLIELATRGWVCFSINYPVSPRAAFPDHIIAVKRAIAWIREHAHTYGGDPRFMMISGNSAGAHLSSLAALSAGDPDFQPGFENADTSVQAAALLYGVYLLTDDQIEELTPRARRHKAGALRYFERMVARRRLSEHRAMFEKASPWHRVGASAPPMFLIHGAMDTLALAEEARAFAARLSEVSSEPVIYAELPRAQHAFETFLSIRSLYAVRAIARFGEWAWERWKSAVSDAVPRETPPGRDPRSPTSPA